MFINGKFDRMLEPGLYWIYKPGQAIKSKDARPYLRTIKGQELLTKDGVSIKISAQAELEIVDPVLEHKAARDTSDVVYTYVQSALRDMIGETEVENLLSVRGTLSKQLFEKVEPQTGALGLKLKQLAIKDIIFPGSLKKSFAQQALAKQESLAALERARGETAALRSLANAARMLEDNPGLFKLRLLQTADESSQVVIHADPNKTG